MRIEEERIDTSGQNKKMTPRVMYITLQNRERRERRKLDNGRGVTEI